MAEQRWSPSVEDREILRRLIADFRADPNNARNRPDASYEEVTAPEVYVARTPHAGISGLTLGTDTTTGTTGAKDDIPGSAYCPIYRVKKKTSAGGGYVMAPVARQTKRVFNLNTCAIPGDRWIQIKRDKFGVWWVDVVAGDCPTLTLTQQECVGGVVVTTTYVITLPAGSTVTVS